MPNVSTRKFISFLVSSFLFSIISFGKETGGKGRVVFVIEPFFNSKPLLLDSGQYVTENKDTLSISLFRFYVTQITFQYSDSIRKFNSPGCSHLYDAEDKSTDSFSFYMPVASFDNVSFTLGVDSLHNTNGANGGDLDPARGMYWAWNTGYIMAKLEGTSKACKTLHNAFEFHIGGYMPPYNTARRVRLEIPGKLNVEAGKNVIIRLKADVAAWFNGNLDLATTNSIVIPGQKAAAMADNYAKMFTLMNIQNVTER